MIELYIIYYMIELYAQLIELHLFSYVDLFNLSKSERVHNCEYFIFFTYK